jgi:hypothetical protein
LLEFLIAHPARNQGVGGSSERVLSLVPTQLLIVADSASALPCFEA